MIATKVRKYLGADAEFKAACDRGVVNPTHRQYRKWCQKRGSAWKNRAKAA